jgi:opacity protein-like surface antigen
VKTKKIEGLESAATVFFMRTQTENIFEGDSGNTAIARGADRIGVEFTNHYRPISWAAFEADVTATHARFRGYDWEQGLLYYGELLQPEAIPYGTFQGNGPGNYLINATPVVATGSIELGEAKGWFGAAKYRYIAPRALTQDGFFKSPAIGTVNLRAGYRWEEGWKLQLDVFNMMNSRSMQIAYAYGSLVGTNTLYSACAPSKTAPDAVCGVGKMGVVGHPIEPPSWRLTFGGPLNFDANPNKRPDLLEPFSMLTKKEGEKSIQIANWTGPYLGLNLGGGSNTASNGNNLWFQDAVYGGITKNMNPNTTGGGLIAGGQAGYTYQLTPLFVTGVEADLQGTTMTGGVNGATYSALLNLNDQTGASYVPGYVNTGSSTLWYGTVRGRGGVTLRPDLWVYGTGGFAYANVQQAAGYQTVNFQTGWTAGGGVEWMFKSNWSAKAEYLYADVQGGPATIGNNYGLQLNNSINSSRWSTIRVGANYHLNFDQVEPVIRKF